MRRSAALLAVGLLCVVAASSGIGRREEQHSNIEPVLDTFNTNDDVLQHVSRERRQVRPCASQHCQALKSKILSSGQVSKIKTETICVIDDCEDEMTVGFFDGSTKVYVCNRNGCSLKGENNNEAQPRPVPSDASFCKNRRCGDLVNQLQKDGEYSKISVHTSCINNQCDDTVTVSLDDGSKRIYKCNRNECSQNETLMAPVNSNNIDTVDSVIPRMPNSTQCRSQFCKDFINKLDSFSKYVIETTCVSNKCEDFITVYHLDNSTDAHLCTEDGCTAVQDKTATSTDYGSVTTVRPPPTTPPSTTATYGWGGQYCGVPVPLGEVLQDPFTDRINNGEEARLGMYPWHTALYHNANQNRSWEYFCGGSLVTTRVVITAGHCIVPFDPTVIQVVLGKVYRQFDSGEETAVKRSVLKVELPPEHNVATPYAWDVGLLLLDAAVQFSRHVMPVCHSARYTLDTIYRRAVHVAGWGPTHNDPRPEILQHVEFSIVDMAVCRKQVPSALTGHDRFCGAIKGVKGPLVTQGDSGGGVTSVFDDKHYIVGIVSINYGDTSIFANVTYGYLEQWMNKTINNLEIEITNHQN